MGLTVHYELRLPTNTTRQRVTELLSALRAFALQLPVATVSQLYDGADAPKDWRESKNECEGAFRFSAEINADRYDDPMVGDLKSSVGFTIMLGEGSEPATFGFIRRADEPGESPE